MNSQICKDCGAKFVNGVWITALNKQGDNQQLASRACYYAKEKGLVNCINISAYNKNKAFNPPKIRNFNEYLEMSKEIKSKLN